MYDFEIAFFLYKMSKIQNILVNSKYRAKAYYSAGMAVDAYTRYIEDMYQKKMLRSIPYVGKKIEECIIEIIETGSLLELEKYEEEYQIKDYSLLLSYGLSDNLLKKLFSESVKSVSTLMNVKDLKEFKDSITKGELEKVQRFTEHHCRCQGNYLAAYGQCLGSEIIEYLLGIKGVKSAWLGGALATACEKIATIEISFEYDGNWDYLVKCFRDFSRVMDIYDSKLEKITGITKFGIPFILSYIEKSAFEDDVSIHITGNWIKGDLHTHSLWTDGIHSIEQMAQAAEERGYEYLAVTDHSVSMHVAHGLSESQALSQIQEIRSLNDRVKLNIIAGIEVDILSDGSLDYSDEVLSQFDFVIAAIHSHFNQTASSLHDRLDQALSNPYVNILAHPTGRLLGRPGVLFCERASYDISINNIINLCKKNNVVLEVNCFPERLDLGLTNIKLATTAGVKVSLGTDAHSLAHLCNIKYGAEMIEQINVKKEMVLNTYSYNELIKFFKTQKSKTRAIKSYKNFQTIKDFNYYFGKNSDIIEGTKSIIGIDLTGSEEKESGWAYMQSDRVTCRRIKSDVELISSVEKMQPDIVSIDSPLAYPKGRCCARKDCECSKYGIMRESEKLLRHFGITVYPCLIDSMVNLTTRGMKIAKTLRGMGYTVIESYPGVAQDVLMIPRKGKTVEQFIHLKQGLISFGIKGDLVENPFITHDEVDALTSALVGYFYLNGQYIGLGNDEEDYLIVPRIQEELLNKRIIIGLSGETGAGKTTVAEYLQFKYGLKYFRYSKIIEERYHVNDKTELQKIGALIAKNSKDQRNLTKYMIDKMKPEEGYVIDGLRHMEDFEELKKYFGEDFVFIYLECRYSNRYKRYNRLHFSGISKEEFELINNHKSEMDILLLQLKAEYRVDNNKGFKDLRTQMDDIIKRESGGRI